MKVLMLGWEFPPHISGGLGTACFGLVGGLRHHGVDVVFVVPHVFGDEDESTARLLGTSGWVIEPPRTASRAWTRNARLPARPGQPRNGPPRPAGDWRPSHSAGDGDGRGDDDGAGGDSKRGRRAGADAASPRRRQRARALPRPRSSTAERVRDLEPAVESSGRAAARHAPDASARRAASSPPPSRSRAADRERSRRARRSRRRRADPPPEPAGPISLGVQGKTGRYSRDLFAEVGRYTMVLADIARREAHDVVHAHDWMTFPGGVAASRASGKPLVVHVHSCEYDRSGDGANPRIVDIEQAGMDAADLVVCVSHYTASVVQLALPRRRAQDPRRPQRRDAPRAAPRVAPGEGDRRAGRAVPRPRHLPEGPRLLPAGRRAGDQGGAHVRFVLGGSGDMLPRMIETAAQLGLARHVLFTGFLRGDDVERMYAMADLYVMPSVSEPFGIAPLEAMALDVPVIVSRQSGVSEILQHALKVDFWDMRDMANKILAVLRRPALRKTLVESGREEVAQMSWDLRGQHLHDLYQELRVVRSLVFYFQVHQPFRLRRYTFFDIGRSSDYFFDESNARIAQRVAEKCYLPMNELLLRRIEATRRRVPLRVLDLGHRARAALAVGARGDRELEAAGGAPARRVPGRDLAPLAGVAVRSRGVPRPGALARAPHPGAVRRATDDVPQHRAGVLERDRAPGREPRLLVHPRRGRRPPARLAQPAPPLPPRGLRAHQADAALLPALRRHRVPLQQPRLGRVAARRRSLGAWVAALPPQDDLVGLFMDYETFGEHQWRDTGIFDFMEHLPRGDPGARHAVPDAERGRRRGRSRRPPRPSLRRCRGPTPSAT